MVKDMAEKKDKPKLAKKASTESEEAEDESDTTETESESEVYNVERRVCLVLSISWLCRQTVTDKTIIPINCFVFKSYSCLLTFQSESSEEESSSESEEEKVEKRDIKEIGTCVVHFCDAYF